MSSRRALGKGLGALIPPTTVIEEDKPLEGGTRDRILEIPLNKLKPNAYQPRKHFDKDRLQELAQSIEEHGVVQPIVVRAVEDGAYEIVAGERRWRACQLLDRETIPAVVKEYTKQELTEIALIENIQREDLNPLEEAYAYNTLIEDFSYSQEELAKKVGKSRPFVTNMLRLLKLSDGVREMLKEGEISIGHARALLGLEGEEQQALAEKILAEGLTVRQTEEIVKKIKNPAKKKSDKNEKPRDYEFYRLETTLEEILGTKVQIRGRKKGRIVIEYFGEEDLGRIIETILGQQ
ncbi:MAG: ParB/RepB/Spo0J family partition protein [Clostridia bacterium]|nr:ParB/RepB/Spo0J family partition protein [Clostridia bacterium]